MEYLFEEEEDASSSPPVADDAADDHGEETIEYAVEAGLEIAGVSPPRVALGEARRESEEFQQQEQDTMKGMLKMLINNQKAFQKTQNTLQKKLDDQEKELVSLRNVSEEDNVNKYDGEMSGMNFRPRRRKKKQRTGQLSEILGYNADLPVVVNISKLLTHWPIPTHPSQGCVFL